MASREELVEQYEDALFALLMDEVAQLEGEEALRLNERLKADPEAALPETLRRRCKKTIQSAFVKQRAQRMGCVAGRVIQRVSVVAMLGVLLFTSVFAASERFRIAALNAVIEIFDDRTQITFQGMSADDGQSNQGEGLDYQYNIALEWLPEGYEVEGGWTFETGGSDYVSFVSPEDGLIDIMISPYDAAMTYSFDTEDCTEKEVTVQGHSAMLYITDEDMLRQRFDWSLGIWSEMAVLWIDESKQIIVHIVATNLAENEMLRLAEGIHWGG